MFNKYLVFKIDKKLLVILIIAFIFATIVGTLSHEFGHYLFAKLRGVNSEIHYGYTSLIYDGNLRGKVKFDYFIFTLGGPFLTILTGIIGFLLLFKYNPKKNSIFSIKHWIFVFLSLFWLRQSANFVTWNIGFLINGRYSSRGDEIKLAKYLGWESWSIILPTAIIGVLVTAIVIFKFIPFEKRFTFIIAGFIGGILGFFIWLEFLGEIILP